MKKKLCIAVMAITAALCCAFGFAACGDTTVNDDPKDNEKETPEEITKVEGSKGLEYTLSDDETYYYFSGLGDCKETEIVIANFYKDKPVKQIGKYNWITNQEGEEFVANLNEEELEKFYEEIGIFTKSDVTSVTMSEGITTIGAYAFFDNQPVGSGFVGNKIVNIVIPESVTTICGGAFITCLNITRLTLPDGLTAIGDAAFSDCLKLANINIPDSVTYIGESAFSDCSGLTSITIGNGVTSIRDAAFYSCSGLTSVTIGNGVISIGERAFYNCNELTSITIPDSVTTIGYGAFYNCRKLTRITIPDSVTSIGDIAFDNCRELTNIYFEGTVEQWKDIEKFGYWNYSTGNYTVHCTDGDIAKADS